MPRTFLALSDAPAAGSTRMAVLAKGKYKHARYGDFTVDDQLLDNLIANHDRVMGGKILVDADHQAERAGQRNTAAMGWGTKLEKDGDTLYMHWKPTPKGKTVVGNEEYLKTSAVYGDHVDEHGVTHKDVLKGVTLTNRPFLQALPSVCLMDTDLAEKLAQPSDAEPRELDAAITQADRDKAAAAGHALPDGSYIIEDAAQLHAAAVLAASRHGNWKAAQLLIRKRAGELGVDVSSLPGFADKVPAQLDHPVSNLDRAMQIALDAAAQLDEPAPGAAPTDGSYSLDSSPAALLQDETALNALAGSVAGSTGAPYHEVVVALSQVADSRTVRDALGRLGRTAGIYVRELAAVETGLRELEARQQQQVRMLEASEQVLADEDEAGRVMLDQGFDRVGYRHDPIAQDRDFERAKMLSSQYASRARFDEDNMLYLDSGLSLVKSLERPAQRKQVKMALAAQPAASSATVRTLDSAEPVKFVSLSAEAMLLALSEWEARGRDKVTLDECAAIVSGHELSSVDGERDGDDVLNTVGPTNPGIGGLGAGHHELDQRIRSHMLEHGCGDYHCGLAAVTGIQFAPVVGGAASR